MQSAIIPKLERELAEPITTERQVVYILVEIRKLLEITHSQAKYDALWFHASWAVHPKMTRGVAAKLLEYFDQVYPLLKDKELYDLPSDLQRAITDAIALRHFQRQLKDFLVQYDLSTSIVERQWTAFLRLYASVIEDCPLIVLSRKLKNLSHVVVHVEDAPGKLPDGAPPKTVAPRPFPNTNQGTDCTYKSGEHSFLFRVYVDPSASASADVFSRLKSYFGNGSKDVSGVGDEAYLDKLGALHVRKGKVRYFLDGARDSNKLNDLAIRIAAQL